MNRHLELEVDLPAPAGPVWLGQGSLEATVRTERQIVLCRWLGILCAAPLAPFLFHGRELLLVWGVCGAAALYSIAFLYYIIPRRPEWLVNGYVTSIGDTVLAGSVVAFTGGLHSEFYLVYYLIAVLCAIRFGGRRALLSIGVAALSYTLIVYADGAPRTSATAADICFRLGFAAVTAVFAGFVFDRARAAERQLDLAAVSAKQALSEATVALTRSLELPAVLREAAHWAARLAGARCAEVETHPPLELREWLWHHDERRTRTETYEEAPARAAVAGIAHEFPVTYGTEAIGRLRVVVPGPAPLDALHRSVVETFAARCGPALANAWTFAAVQLQALVDPTTGLANHRRFKEYLADCEREAQARPRPLSILMLDVDMFKEFNDTFGHLAGDRALRRLGRLLADCVGDRGLAARYGGDEFVAVLPALGTTGAADIADAVLERFRAALAEGVDGLAPPMGLSVGCATAAAGELDYQTLVGRADLAMYLAKRSGGGVRVFDNLEEDDPLRSLVGSIAAQFSKVRASARSDRRARSGTRAHRRHPGPAHTSEVIQTLLVAIRSKDHALYVHCRNVARLCFRLARRMGLSAWEVHDVGIAGLLHDVGKICVPDAILQKPGRLEPHEMAVVRRHSVHGAEILAPVPSLAAVATAVRHHHENFDGTGYPDGLAGDGIPLPARIVLVADAYDAITSDRPYRAGRDPETALRILHEHRGSQFDPAVVATLTTLLTELNGVRARRGAAQEARLR